MHAATMCASRCDGFYKLQRKPCPVAALCALPQAAQLCAGDITSLLRLSIKWGLPSAATPLLSLPGMQQMDCNFMADLYVKASRLGGWMGCSMMDELVR